MHCKGIFSPHKEKKNPKNPKSRCFFQEHVPPIKADGEGLLQLFRIVNNSKKLLNMIYEKGFSKRSSTTLKFKSEQNRTSSK